MFIFCIFASGTGSNFIEIHRFSKKNSNKMKINLLISDKIDCGAVDYAKNNKIDYIIVNAKLFPDVKDQESRICESLKFYKINFIALAGYIKKVPITVINDFKNKILNIHPSLLPKFGGKGFYGMNVHNAVIQSKESKTGVTIHFVNKDYDKGPIVYQEEIPVYSKDNAEKLSKRVLRLEHKTYKKIISYLINDKIMWNGNKPEIRKI
ncbi:MAG: phosphoribosylglycinamide formyltransferase [Candidatus Marinimicrobia bacterium]|nr:phosphoribosylglycinamide formyltransferase [Candidatus Neomarinimicrobiota bacterium]|tara:strand:+ start:77 stop:700 length:624 start_codon:yes stop_codon:yes gene_type:complete